MRSSTVRWRRQRKPAANVRFSVYLWFRRAPIAATNRQAHPVRVSLSGTVCRKIRVNRTFLTGKPLLKDSVQGSGKSGRRRSAERSIGHQQFGSRGWRGRGLRYRVQLYQMRRTTKSMPSVWQKQRVAEVRRQRLSYTSGRSTAKYRRYRPLSRREMPQP